MTHRNKENGTLVEAVKFSEKTKWEIIGLFKGGGKFYASFRDNQIVVAFEDERPVLTMNVGEFVVKEEGKPIASYPLKTFKQLYEAVK